ncbi:MAG: NADH-quinone oxidoreductase subunit C [Actinomycetota bacterium]|jgi:NADH-quinone oxidoreductase subunit C|nr:NADH-quinone oxidoreductase subunit C [Actinomycetota bacterium]
MSSPGEGSGGTPPDAADVGAGGALDLVGTGLPQIGAAVTGTEGSVVYFPTRERYHDLLAALRDVDFELLTDLCGVDYLTHPGRHLPDGVAPERFELSVVLRSIARRLMVRVRVQVPEEDPEVASAWDLYPGSEAMEREAFDMFGIRFAGHPDLTRILMPEEWEGHPLRKDYGVGRVPVQFKEAPGPR